MNSLSIAYTTYFAYTHLLSIARKCNYVLRRHVQILTSQKIFVSCGICHVYVHCLGRAGVKGMCPPTIFWFLAPPPNYILIRYYIYTNVLWIIYIYIYEKLTWCSIAVFGHLFIHYDLCFIAFAERNLKFYRADGKLVACMLIILWFLVTARSTTWSWVNWLLMLQTQQHTPLKNLPKEGMFWTNIVVVL